MRGTRWLVSCGLAFATSVVLGVLLAADIARATVDAGFRAAQEARHGASTETVARRRGALIAFLLDRADEARALAYQFAGDETA